MNKRTNHWYLFDIAFRGAVNVRKASLRTWAVWMVLIVGFLVAIQLGVVRPDQHPVLVQLVLPVIVGLAIGIPIWRAKTRAARVPGQYVAALKAPDPAEVVEIVRRSMEAADAFPDIDAYRAQSTALALALYGREDEARAALAAVPWGAKAPLIQATGLSAEAVVVLLCRRDAASALALANKARELASISPNLPGAAATARYHATVVGVSEALAGELPAASRAALEASSANARLVPLRVLSLFGLAAAAERDGDGARADELRRTLLELAPHCAPLQLTVASFTTDGTSSSGVVASAISAGGDQGIAARAKARAAPIKVLVLWVVVLAAFLAIWRFLDAGSP